MGLLFEGIDGNILKIDVTQRVITGYGENNSFEHFFSKGCGRGNLSS